jgi:peptide/nickel transport system ATP-binding protein/oligopeptide transport system ATP-binding protein
MAEAVSQREAARSDGAEPVLSMRGLRTSVSMRDGSVDVVRGVSLDLYPDEVLCLVGESGCGKTITALSIMRLLPTPPVRIREGQVLFNGRDLLGLSDREMRRVRSEEISMIFQDPLTSLDPVFSIGHVMAEVIRAHRDVDRSIAHEMSIEILDDVGIPDPHRRIDSYPHELSGGMRQRVMIGLALVLDPQILVADEPTTALDVTVQAQILEKLLEEQRERHMSMLLITHDLAVVASVADRVAVMYAGEIVEEAPVDELFEDPKHPYTQGLLRALPHASVKRDALIPIAGRVPPPQMMPPGCFFAPRCPDAIQRCWDDHPEHIDRDGRTYRCINSQPFHRR